MLRPNISNSSWLGASSTKKDLKPLQIVLWIAQSAFEYFK